MTQVQLPKDRYALLTGASLGLGRSMALECAKQGWNVLLVALPDDSLEEAAKVVREAYPNIKVDHLGVDLSQTTAAEQVFEWCQSKGYQLHTLINNAGLGHRGEFIDFDNKVFETIINVNNLVIVKLTRLFLPQLMEIERSYLMNVGSIASYIDAPYKVVYASSKRFINTFSRTLRYEHRNGPVSVSLLAPSGILTNEFVLETVAAMGPLARASSYHPEMVARVAIKKMLKGKATIKPGGMNKFMIFLSRVLPYKVTERIVARSFSKGAVPNYP